jgi:hypothetical protein
LSAVKGGGLVLGVGEDCRLGTRRHLIPKTQRLRHFHNESIYKYCIVYMLFADSISWVGHAVSCKTTVQCS